MNFMAVSSSSLGLALHFNPKRGGAKAQQTVIWAMKLAVGPIRSGVVNTAPTILGPARGLFIIRRFCSPSNAPLAVSLTKRVPKNCSLVSLSYGQKTRTQLD